jgi:hypothetical protein
VDETVAASRENAFPALGILRESCACLSSRRADAIILWDGPPWLNPNASAARDSGVYWPTMQRAGQTSTCEGSKRRQIRNGLSVVTIGWPSSATAQALCAQPMMQLMDDVDRLQYLATRTSASSGFGVGLTPAALGNFRAFDVRLEIIRMEPGVSYCYDRVAVCNPAGVRPNARTIRQTHLIPHRTGLLTVPTSRSAHRLASKVRMLCGLPKEDEEDAAAGDQSQRVESSASYARVGTARILVRNQTAPLLVGASEVATVMRRHLAHVEVVHVTAPPSAEDFCTQVRWMQSADIVLSHHGSHLANGAYMRRGQHLIEIVPFLYERDDNYHGCAPRTRHVLVGADPATQPTGSIYAHDSTRTRGCISKTSQEAARSHRCRKELREAPVLAPLGEIDLLVRRIVAGRSSAGGYRCDERRCTYV